jgi:hypothetical protein
MAHRLARPLLAKGALVLSMLAGCSSSGSGAGKPLTDGGTQLKCPTQGPLLASDCDPIGGFCGFPFPSNVYLTDDPTGKNPSKKRVEFGPKTLPFNIVTKANIDPAYFYGLDGFSPASAAMTYLPGATAAGLATPLDIPSTLDSNSPTLILDVKTGKLVPHWVDIDQQTDQDSERAIMLHPAVLLTNDARYIVAIRNVRDANGTAIPPNDAWKALRDGTDSPDASVQSRRCLYQDIFAALAKAGVKKDDLQIAWDFTVGSRKSITGPLLAVRDAALAVVGADGPAFALKPGSVEENPNPDIMRRMVLTMKAPLYMTSVTYTPGAMPPEPVPHLQWDASGNPQQNGTMDVDVLVQIPNSVKTVAEGHGLLQNGHGLFGSKGEGQNGYMARAANGWHWIGFGVDFYGFAGDDAFIALEALQSRPELFTGFYDRQIQGHVNQLVAMRLMMGAVAKSGVRDETGTLILDPKWIDPTIRAYRGDSQGGIMGGTYMSISTDVTRGYLGEYGTPYSVLLNRSTDATGYNQLLKGSYLDGRNVQIMWGLIQIRWDRSEPSGFVPFMTENTLPGTLPHHVLMHDALGDHQVTTAGAHIMARAVGAKLLKSNDPAQPVVRDVFGLEQASAPLQDQSAIVEWDFGLPPEVLTNQPSASGCDPHDRVRDTTPAYEQQDKFFRTGTIDWFCDGICNCNGPKPEQRCDVTYKDQCCKPPGGLTDPLCQ